MSVQLRVTFLKIIPAFGSFVHKNDTLQPQSRFFSKKDIFFRFRC